MVVAPSGDAEYRTTHPETLVRYEPDLTSEHHSLVSALPACLSLRRAARLQVPVMQYAHPPFCASGHRLVERRRLRWSRSPLDIAASKHAKRFYRLLRRVKKAPDSLHVKIPGACHVMICLQSWFGSGAGSYSHDLR